LPTSDLDNQTAIELPGNAVLRAHDGALFATRFGDPATMVRYTLDSSGELEEAGRLSVPGARTFSTVAFAGPTEAYATLVSGASHVMKFNPATMEKTGEVDMSGAFRKGEGDSAFYRTYYLGSLIRDGKLFLSVHYEKSFVAVFDSAFVAVIDLASGKLEKVISDGRTNGIFGNGELVKTLDMDGSGDIYVQAKAFDTTVMAGKVSQPSGILRIRKGEERFDPDYFLDLREAAGADCYGLHLVWNGEALTARIEDPSDPWEMNGPNFRVWRIDLAERKSLGALDGLPKVKGSSNTWMRSFDGKSVLIHAAAQDGNALYAYDPSSGKVERKFAMAGMLTGLAEVRR
jgi:hypothetical protein